MDDVFSEILRLGYGSDSIMLGLLRSAMDEAHENVQSKDGSIELLNARSKFYEIAMILVEGCSKLIQEKTEIPENNREKMLTDLKESRDMVRGRLEELKFSIVDKDIELVESYENECKLRQTLESKDKELVSLRARLKLERTKSEEISNYGEKDRGFCDLKNSVDQQMLSIKQKLEDERLSLSSANDLCGDENFDEGSMNDLRPEQSVVIEQMSSDIDCLKGTLDLAFLRMQKDEIGPLEKQWRWEIEKDTILISVNGFMSYISEQWPQLIDEITNLYHELKAFTSDENEPQEKEIHMQGNFEPSKNLGRTSSEPLPEFDDKSNEDQDSEKSTYVAKMKKYHESVIRKQHEELNWMKIRDIFRGKGSKKIKGDDNLGGRIREVMLRLDNFIKWDTKVRDQKCLWEKRQVPKKEKIEYENERKLKQKGDDFSMQIMLIEETYVSLMKGLIKDIYQEFHSYELKSLIKDNIVICFIKEMVNEREILFEDKSSDETIATILKEDIYTILFRNVVKEFEIQIECCKFENLIREEIYSFIILEVVKSETAFMTEVGGDDLIPRQKTVLEEENLIRKYDSSGKCDKNEEELLLNEDLSFKSCEWEHLINQMRCSISIPLVQFQSSIGEFESFVHQKLETNFPRLEGLTRKTQDLFQMLGSFRKEKLIYKKAFEIRCHNLRLAEAEVDLLGDQVEELVDLLETIYLILDEEPKVLSCEFQLSTILNLMEKKLGRSRNSEQACNV